MIIYYYKQSYLGVESEESIRYGKVLLDFRFRR
jgi:hypothetical protein